MTDLRAGLARYGSCTLDQDGCHTCGDIVVPVRLLTLEPDGGAVVEDRVGNQTEVTLELVPGSRPGDVLLVHLGVAIARVPDPPL